MNMGSIFGNMGNMMNMVQQLQPIINMLKEGSDPESMFMKMCGQGQNSEKAAQAFKQARQMIAACKDNNSMQQMVQQELSKNGLDMQSISKMFGI